MTLSWSDWAEIPEEEGIEVSPCVHWLREVMFLNEDEKDGLSIAPLPRSRMACGLTPGGPIAGNKLTRAPLPPFARPGPDDTVADDPYLQLTWTPDIDCAIVGVIDSALALAHERFRRIDGGTRFLSAWLMGAEWRDGAAVPFGRELFRSEIDRLMWKAKRSGTVDEAAFDRMAHATNFRDALGDRRLEWRGTHGTAVADLAAGFDLRDSSFDSVRRRLPLIGVGLPPRTSMGASGNFLEFFAIYAVEYILDRADRIWDACGYGDGGFPIVINLSYGLQAGPKDGHMLIEEVIRTAARLGEERGRPIRVILPAGNDGDSEGAAVLDLDPNTGAQTLGWRLKPEDHTPNYAEIWSDRIDGPGAADATHPASLRVAPPIGPESPAAPGKAGHMTTLIDSARPDEPIARIYCVRHDDVPPDSTDHATNHRVGYILCTRPTLETSRKRGAASGEWRLTLSSEDKARIFAYVQSDQSLTFGSNTGLVATFAHPVFNAYDEFGRMTDVYDYPTDGGTPNLTDTTPPMARRGTLNTIASLREARVIGSYRGTDGKPSVYSSSARSDAVPISRTVPTALFPGEDGAATFGLLATGSRSGSSTAFSGTSFSTALATRSVALAMLEWIDSGRIGDAPGTEAWFQAKIASDEAAASWPGKTMPEKAGYGRATPSDTRPSRDEVRAPAPSAPGLG